MPCIISGSKHLLVFRYAKEKGNILVANIWCGIKKVDRRIMVAI